jgi:hypothetical protein
MTEGTEEDEGGGEEKAGRGAPLEKRMKKFELRIA